MLTSSQKMASTTEGKIGFLHLPAEVRNDIYNLSMANNEPVGDGYIDIDYTRTRVTVPALLLASKQVQLEAGPIFYAPNKFRCWGSGDAQRFLKGLKTEEMAALRHVRCMSFITKTAMSSNFYSYDFSVKGCFNWANDKLGDLLETFLAQCCVGTLSRCRSWFGESWSFVW